MSFNAIDLFAGGGIGSLAHRLTIPGYRTVLYIEKDAYCQETLIARIKDKAICNAPIWDDVRTFDGQPWSGKVDFISAGFPCQPFSVAGKRKGETDDRNLWPDTIRIISEVRPCYAFLENVPGLFVHEYIRTIFADLAKIGYDCQWLPLSAAEVGAPHRREREWILAYPRHGRGWPIQSISERDRQTARREFYSSQVSRSGEQSETVADSKISRLQRNEPTGSAQTRGCFTERGRSWPPEPKICRVAHGMAFRVGQIRQLGNGWVPDVVRKILQTRIIG